jgi:ElaB/YqjD/DUF883 family membrane-anchored ribosome-binding protein
MNATSERPGTNRDPEHLGQAAERIRADLERTLDALERKLSPSQLLDRSLAYLREHGGDAARTVGDTVRNNPVPIVLAVAGIGWLIAASVRKRNPIDPTFGDESLYADELDDELDDELELDEVDTDEQIRHTRFHDPLIRARARTRRATRRAQHQVVSAVADRPILFGGLAVAIGALLGVLIPSTEYEDKIVGQVRDRAVERAKQMGERQYQNLRSRLETHRDLEVSGHAH